MATHILEAGQNLVGLLSQFRLVLVHLRERADVFGVFLKLLDRRE